MKFVTYVENKEQFLKLSELLKNKQVKSDDVEVIVGTRELSRYSEGSVEELLEIIALNQNEKLNLALEWDVLNQENRFQKTLEVIKKLPMHEFRAIRVQDPGALHFVKENFPWLKVQLILENGNHNHTGLERWEGFLGESLDRLVLSNELSKDHLKKYTSSLKAPLEVLVFGRILLFYSPRLLLSPLKKEEISQNLLQKNIEAFGTSEESPHAGFPLIENSHGTFMFNVKDLYLVEHLKELYELNIGAIRFDLRFDNTFKHLSDLIDCYLGKKNAEEIGYIKNDHPRLMIKGFYNINKTDVLFTKLKNKRTQRTDENYVGEIVDVERDEQMALVIKSKDNVLRIGDEIRLITPEGKDKVLTVKSMTDTNQRPVEEARVFDIVLLPFLSGIIGKTQVYFTK